MRHFYSNWMKDQNEKLSDHKPLKAGELSYIKELLLVNNPNTRTIWGQSIAFYFDYPGIDEKVFTSAAIDGTFNVHIVVLLTL